MLKRNILLICGVLLLNGRIALAELPTAPTFLTLDELGAATTNDEFGNIATIAQIHLSWIDNSNDESGFKIERDGILLQTTDANVTDYIDTTICDTTHFYKVQATNLTGNSIGITDSITTCLPIPTDLTVTPVAPTQIDLTWVDNSSDEIGFRIEHPIGTILAITDANITNYKHIHTGLICGSDYDYSITAIYANGTSATTFNSIVTQACPSVPAAPTNLTTKLISATQIDLTWFDQSNNDTGFKVEFNDNTILTLTNSYSHTDLDCGTTYDYQVKATNSIGDSASITLTATTLECPVALRDLSINELNELTVEQIQAIDAEQFKQMESIDISKFFVNLNKELIKPEDIQQLIPDGWTLDLETGALMAPIGSNIILKNLATPPLPEQLSLLPVVDLNAGFGLGGTGKPVINSTSNVLAKADLTDFILSQDEYGTLIVEGTADSEGIQYTFRPDADNIVQVDSDKIPIGVITKNGGFYSVTTPDNMQYDILPAPSNPLELSTAIGNGEITFGKHGDVFMQLGSNTRNGSEYLILMFDPFIEPAPEDWCIEIDGGELFCDFDNAPLDLQPGFHFPRERAGLNLPQGKVVYHDGTSQKVVPTVHSPDVFIAEVLKFPGVEKIFFHANGIFYVLHEGQAYILVPKFNIKIKDVISPASVKLEENGTITYSIPIIKPDDKNLTLIFSLSIEPVLESWCVDLDDGGVFCDFYNIQ